MPTLTKKERRRLRKSLALVTMEWIANHSDVPEHVKKDVKNNLITWHILGSKPATVQNAN